MKLILEPDCKAAHFEDGTGCDQCCVVYNLDGPGFSICPWLKFSTKGQIG